VAASGIVACLISGLLMLGARHVTPGRPIEDRPTTPSDHQQLCEQLLIATGASRTTIRIVDAAGRPELVAEALAPGVPSMSAATAVNPERFPTYTYLAQKKEILVQQDTRTHPIRPPDSLIDELRVYAQMLAPVLRDGELFGTISVHIQDRSHEFTPAEVAALRDTQRWLTAMHTSVFSQPEHSADFEQERTA
jgi:hypothetical protein